MLQAWKDYYSLSWWNIFFALYGSFVRVCVFSFLFFVFAFHILLSLAMFYFAMKCRWAAQPNVVNKHITNNSQQKNGKVEEEEEEDDDDEVKSVSE